MLVYRYGGHNLKTHAVAENLVDDVKGALKVFLEDDDDEIDMEKMKKLQYPKLHEFFELHCRKENTVFRYSKVL